MFSASSDAIAFTRRRRRLVRGARLEPGIGGDLDEWQRWLLLMQSAAVVWFSKMIFYGISLTQGL